MLRNTFIKKFISYLYLSLHNATSLEFLLSPLIAGLAHLMNQVRIKCLRTMSEGMSVYSVLIAEPASGKSPAMTIIRNSLLATESYLAIPPEETKHVNGNLFSSKA